MSKPTIQKIQNINELKELLQVFSLAFESGYTTSDSYLETMIHNPTCMILGATIDAQIVGGLVAFYRAIGGEEVAVNHFNFTLGGNE